jgi:hypothetical protein
MNLTPEQTKVVAAWVAAGDSLSVIQKKLSDELKLSLKYMEVRFLVDDLNLQLKDAAPKADASDVSKGSKAPTGAPTAPEKKGFFDKAKEKLGLSKESGETEPHGDEDGDLDPATGAIPEGVVGSVRVDIDKANLNPGAMASGSVTFSDGVTAKWIIDNYGRPGLTETSKPGYRPSPADAQAFMQELSQALQQKGY